MAFPVIKFNNSTGSDTQASGAGPDTAVFGTGASLSSSTSVDLSADSPDLSGVATDGSACLWVLTSSGRQFSKITGVDNGTKIVTVETAYGVTESGRTWAIGGKRATWDDTNSRNLFGSTGALASWTVITETDQTITSALLINSPGAFTIKSDNALIRRTINQTANAACFSTTSGTSAVTIIALKFTNSNATKTSATGLAHSASRTYICINCELGDSTNKLFRASSTSASYFHFIYCNIHDCTISSLGYVCDMSNVNSSYRFDYCWIHDNPNARIVREDSSYSFHMFNCVVENNGGAAVLGSQNKYVFIVANTFDSNGESPIQYAGASFSNGRIINNQFTNNTGYGIRLPASVDFDIYLSCVIDYNNFYNNSSGSYNGTYSGGANDTANNPNYIDSANGDFTLALAARALGYPGNSLADLPSVSHVDQGAIQSVSNGGVMGANTRGGFVN